MAASPKWKVYAPNGEYRASCKYIEDAACLVAIFGEGATINHGHGKALWREGSEDQSAGESYDHVAEVVLKRLTCGVGAMEPG